MSEHHATAARFWSEILHPHHRVTGRKSENSDSLSWGKCRSLRGAGEKGSGPAALCARLETLLAPCGKQLCAHSTALQSVKNNLSGSGKSTLRGGNASSEHEQLAALPPAHQPCGDEPPRLPAPRRGQLAAAAGCFPQTPRRRLSYLIQRVHRDVGGFDVLQVSLSVVFEIIGDAEPAKQGVGLVMHTD